MKKIALTFVALSVMGVAQADVKDYVPDAAKYLPEAKLKDSRAELKDIYVGVGLSRQLLHVNAEWVNSYGIAYAKGGAFTSNDYEFGAQVGFRYPYHLTGTDQNGYYFGVYAGHLDSVKLDGESHQRLGLGVDLAYVFLSKQRISTFSVGVGAAEKVEGRNGSVSEMKPQLQFAYSLSFGVF